MTTGTVLMCTTFAMLLLVSLTLWGAMSSIHELKEYNIALKDEVGRLGTDCGDELFEDEGEPLFEYEGGESYYGKFP